MVKSEMKELKQQFEKLLTKANLKLGSPSGMSSFLNWIINRCQDEKVAILHAHVDIQETEDELHDYS